MPASFINETARDTLTFFLRQLSSLAQPASPLNISSLNTGVRYSPFPGKNTARVIITTVVCPGFAKNTGIVHFN